MRPFGIERYFARYEHDCAHLLSSSDCEPLTLEELLESADLETASLWRGLSLGYTESLGLPELRRQIARLYDGIGSDQVIEVVPEEGILLAMQAVLEPGDHVVATFPGYQSLYSIAEDMGCRVTRWTPRTADGWRFDVEDLRAAVTPGTKLVVVNFPHNPTGAHLTPDEFAEVIAIASAAGARVFSDEMYRWLERDAADRLPSACELDDRAVTLCGMSKTFSLPGLRVGWLATRDAGLMGAIAQAKDYTTICGSAPSEVLALMGLRIREGIAAANRATIEVNRAAVDRLVAAHPATLSWTPPQAGSVALMRLACAGGAEELCESLARDASVMLLPATVFELPDDAVRIGLGRAALPDGLAALDAFLTARGL